MHHLIDGAEVLIHLHPGEVVVLRVRGEVRDGSREAQRDTLRRRGLMSNRRRWIGIGLAVFFRSPASRIDEILPRKATCTPCFNRPFYRLVSVQVPIAHVFCRATYLGGRAGQSRESNGQGS